MTCSILPGSASTNRPRAGSESAQPYVLAEKAPQHAVHPLHEVPQVKGARLQDLAPAECEELGDEGRCPLCRALDLLHVCFQLEISPRILQGHLAVSRDHREDVVEVMGNPPGKPAHRLHFLGLLQLVLEPCPFLFRAGKVGNVAADAHDPGHLTVRVENGDLCRQDFSQRASGTLGGFLDVHDGQPPPHHLQVACPVAVGELLLDEIVIRFADQVAGIARPHEDGLGLVRQDEAAVAVLQVDVVRQVVDEGKQQGPLLLQAGLQQPQLRHVPEDPQRAGDHPVCSAPRSGNQLDLADFPVGALDFHLVGAALAAPPLLGLHFHARELGRAEELREAPARPGRREARQKGSRRPGWQTRNAR